MIRIVTIEREFGCTGSVIRSMNMGLSKGQAGLSLGIRIRPFHNVSPSFLANLSGQIVAAIRTGFAHKFIGIPLSPVDQDFVRFFARSRKENAAASSS